MSLQYFVMQRHAMTSSSRYILGECRALWGSPDILHVNIVVKAGQYMKTVKAMISIIWKQVCDRRGLLLAEPFSVSVSASNVVVRITMKLLKDDF